MIKTNTVIHHKRGLWIMLIACLLLSIVHTSVYAVTLADPHIPAIEISFIRVFINWLILVIPALIKREVLALFGDRSFSLWLRGIFGSGALMLSFLSIARIGPGESAFLTATSGVFIALLSPWVLKQKNSLGSWIAILGSVVGVYFLFHDKLDNSHDLIGRLMALSSGFFSALAYLMVAKAGRNNSARTVVFYFCFAAVLLHLIYFSINRYYLPENTTVWQLLLMVGIIGSGSQYALTRAYQAAPATLVSAIGYLTPVLSLLWGMLLFAQIPAASAILGASLIFLFGVLLPFLR